MTCFRPPDGPKPSLRALVAFGGELSTALSSVHENYIKTTQGQTTPQPSMVEGRSAATRTFTVLRAGRR